MILLDTHAWIWWTSDPSCLSPRAKEVTDAAAAGGHLYLSCISTWEVAMLVQRGRLALSMEVADWVNHSEALPFLTFVPITNPIALRAVALKMHPDPADRLIAATALYLGATLVTKDEKLVHVPKLRTLW